TVFVFFFSSRRRHTRFSRDWSSDVCSSDLLLGRGKQRCPSSQLKLSGHLDASQAALRAGGGTKEQISGPGGYLGIDGLPHPLRRSEERRVGKACRARWCEDAEKRKAERQGD